jgi:hypothetical protein
VTSEFACPTCSFPYPVVTYTAIINEDVMVYPEGEGVEFGLAGETVREVIPVDRPSEKITAETMVNCVSCSQQSKLGEWVTIAEPPPEGQMEI